jgi:glutaconate CoA-transferase subunit B
MPTDEQLAIIRRLDPHNLRATVIKNVPPAIR